jgi:hypothetical protein
MIGPLTTASGGFTHVLVAIEKFTKWIEYKPLTKLTPDNTVDFICDILHRFGFPTLSSRIWAPTSQQISSGNSMTTRQSKSSMCQLHTQGQMAKSRGPMA